MTQKTYTYWRQKLRQLNWETPFQAIDVALARSSAVALKKLMPRVSIYYALKSNNDPRLIKALNDEVSGFEIASQGEYGLLESLGVSSGRVLFGNPVKIPRHIRETYRAGVKYYAFDSLGEVYKLAKEAPGAEVYARVKVNDEHSAFPLSEKFGMESKLVVPYMREAALSGLQPTGLAFHVGSQSEHAGVWSAAIQTCGELIETLSRDGVRITLIDIGGGLPALYEGTSSSALPEAARAINAAIERYLPPHVCVIAEPGRAISASCSVIATTVIGRELRTDGREWLFLDMGVFQGLMEPLELPTWKYPVFTDRLVSEQKHRAFVLTGPTCDACDTIGADYMLPEDISVGDRIYIGATGAYTTVYGSTFNGFDIPKIYYV